MPQFRYRVREGAGLVSEGVISAANANEAVRQLGMNGLQVLEIAPSALQPPIARTPGQQPPVPAAQRPFSRSASPPRGTFNYVALNEAGQEIAGSLHLANGEQAVRDLTARGLRPIQLFDAKTGEAAMYRTKPSSDKQRFFVFSQLAQQVKAGISPAQACKSLSASYSGGPMTIALQHAGRAAEEGGALSSVLELYPDLFPEHVSGMVRAGELGGFLPEALMAVSDQALQSHKFKRFFWFVWFGAINALLMIPLAFYVRKSVLDSWNRSEASGGSGGPSDVLGPFMQALLWPTLPTIVALSVAALAARKLLSSRKMTRFRHRLGLKVKTYGTRARYENLSIFSWALAKLGKAGIPSKTAWWLAANTVPNLAIRDKLERLGASLREGSKLSDGAKDPQLFPPEYAPMLMTGEMTGDIEGSLMNLAEVSRQEYETAQSYAKLRSGCWGVLAIAVTAGIVLIVIAYMWYRELPARVLEGIELIGPSFASAVWGSTVFVADLD